MLIEHTFWIALAGLVLTYMGARKRMADLEPGTERHDEWRSLTRWEQELHCLDAAFMTLAVVFGLILVFRLAQTSSEEQAVSDLLEQPNFKLLAVVGGCFVANLLLIGVRWMLINIGFIPTRDEPA